VWSQNKVKVIVESVSLLILVEQDLSSPCRKRSSGSNPRQLVGAQRRSLQNEDGYRGSRDKPEWQNILDQRKGGRRRGIGREAAKPSHE
jgi:hypothetical protein